MELLVFADHGVEGENVYLAMVALRGVVGGVVVIASGLTLSLCKSTCSLTMSGRCHSIEPSWHSIQA